jgi:hypothetical protein
VTPQYPSMANGDEWQVGRRSCSAESLAKLTPTRVAAHNTLTLADSYPPVSTSDRAKENHQSSYAPGHMRPWTHTTIAGET